jgi:hypothetical protein
VKAHRRAELVAYLRQVSEEDMGLPGTDPLDAEKTADFLFSAQKMDRGNGGRLVGDA